MFIRTVTGDIHPNELGLCQCHEHLFIAKGKPANLNPALCIDSYYDTYLEVMRYKLSGGASIVDAQPIGCGRIADWLLELSIETGVKIVTATGFHKVEFYPDQHWIFSSSEDFLTRLFVGEICDGVYTDGDRGLPQQQINAKAGIIKCAMSDYGIKGIYYKLFSVATNVCLETGAPLLCHTEAGAHAMEMIEFFVSKGVNASSIIVCHMDRRVDNFDLHKAVAQTGAYLEYDTIGRYKYHSDEEEATLITKMLENGFEDNIILSLDTTRERLKSYGGTIGLDYIMTHFIPVLKAHGISESTIAKLLYYNPRRALTIH